jgi:hypothetical protein
MLRAEWRFLQLTMFIGAWMLLAPMLQDRWLVQLLLQLFLLNTLLVTLWANPGWPGLRTLMIGLWLVSLTGSILAILPLSPDWRHIMRSIELVSSPCCSRSSTCCCSNGTPRVSTWTRTRAPRRSCRATWHISA